MNKKLKIAFITLVIVLISMISFGGIYQKGLNSYHNVMKEYLLARNLKGSRVVELKVDQEEATEETESEEKKEENNITKEKLKEAKKVLEGRLKDLGSEDYVIEQNKEDGTTTIYLTEDDLTDNITGYLSTVGEFKVVDSEDENNVLMSKDDLKVAKVGYSQATSGTTVYLSIEFNKAGKKKLEDISNTYVKTTDEQGNETEKKISIKLDDTEVLSTSFDETIQTGMLQMSIGSASTSSSDLQGYIMQANGMATLLNHGTLPIEYTMEKNEYVSLDSANQMIQIGLAIISVLLVIEFIVLIIKYRVNGLKVCMASIGAIAIFALLIRYTNVYLALESIIAAVVLILMMTYLNMLILKNKKEKDAVASVLEAYKTSWKVTLPALIIAVILSFIAWVPVASIGMCMLWGLISLVIGSFVFTLPILKAE